MIFYNRKKYLNQKRILQTRGELQRFTMKMQLTEIKGKLLFGARSLLLARTFFRLGGTWGKKLGLRKKRNTLP